MRAPVDVGLGLDPSVLFPDLPLPPSNEQILPPTQPLIANEKVAYLQMQQAILNKDAPALSALVNAHPALLTDGRKNTLGRLVVKHFTPQLATALGNVDWDNVVTLEMMMGCVNADNSGGFDFCLQKIAPGQARAPSDTFVSMLYNSLTSVNKKNYLLYNAYRAKVAVHLTAAERQEAAYRLCANLFHITPSSSVCYTALRDELQNVEWKEVFDRAFAMNTFVHITSPDRLCGMAWLLSVPPIAQAFAAAQNDWSVNRAHFKEFVRTTVMSNDAQQMFSDEYQSQLNARIFRDTANDRLLSPFDLVWDMCRRQHYPFLSKLESAYDTRHPHKKLGAWTTITQKILLNDASACLKLPASVVHTHLLEPLDADSFSRQLLRLPSRTLKKIRQHVNLDTRDHSGHSVLHRLAHLLAHAEFNDVKKVIAAFETLDNWGDTKNATGQTPKEVVLERLAQRPLPEQALLSEILLKSELTKTLGSKIRNKRAAPSRKM